MSADTNPRVWVDDNCILRIGDFHYGPSLLDIEAAALSAALAANEFTHTREQIVAHLRADGTVELQGRPNGKWFDPEWTADEWERHGTPGDVLHGVRLVAAPEPATVDVPLAHVIGRRLPGRTDRVEHACLDVGAEPSATISTGQTVPLPVNADGTVTVLAEDGDR